MKKEMSFLVLLVSLMVLATGCSDIEEDSSRKNVASGGVDEVLFQKISEEDNITAVYAETIEEEQDKSQDPVVNSAESASEEIPAEISIEDNSSTTTSDAAEQDTEYQEEAAPGVDVDLTVLSSTMVYSEVYNMMIAPDDYIGKTVKMEGQFVPYYDESTGKYYFACFISDATACCSQGIEFILTDEYSYPDDYPKEGDNICVVGTFDTYMEGEAMYCTLRDAVLG